MKKRKTFMGMIIIISILVLGVGYAAINGVELFVNGTANITANADFSVEYDTSHTIGLSTTSTTSWDNGQVAVVAGTYTDTHNAIMTVHLDSTHRDAYAIYKIVNKSPELYAMLDSNVSSQIAANAAEYLTVSEELYSNADCTGGSELDSNAKLAPGSVAYLKVQVNLSKLPIEDIGNATFTITVNATPVEAD